MITASCYASQPHPAPHEHFLTTLNAMRKYRMGWSSSYSRNRAGVEPDDLLCSRNARLRKALVGRAQWEINQAPPLRDYEQTRREHLFRSMRAVKAGLAILLEKMWNGTAPSRLTVRQLLATTPSLHYSPILVTPPLHDRIHVEISWPILPLAVEVDIIAVGCRIRFVELKPRRKWNGLAEY